MAARRPKEGSKREERKEPRKERMTEARRAKEMRRKK
jgi:hypothetical protein